MIWTTMTTHDFTTLPFYDFASASEPIYFNDTRLLDIESEKLIGWWMGWMGWMGWISPKADAVLDKDKTTA
jgi:hypothetical protein